jgi:hypothetical protein
VGETLYDEAHRARIVGVGDREKVNRKKKFSAVFLQPIQNPSYMSHVLLLCVSFLRVLVVLYLTCDMYMCRLRHINDSVLSSLKMEGIRLLFSFQRELLALSQNQHMNYEKDTRTAISSTLFFCGATAQLGPRPPHPIEPL